MNGARVFLEVLKQSGVQYLFGNPGSTELPLMDALAGEPTLDYRLALHEIPAVAMADGYAQATRRPAVVNLHVSCGVGNAMGMLYNAWCAGSPLVVTAGQQDRRLRFEEPVLAGDLLGVTRPWTKWSAEVNRVEDVAAATRRALQEAMTPPTGPVFLSLPVDLQSESAEGADLSPAHVPQSGRRPSEEALKRAAEVLLAAERPVIVAGSRVMEDGASRDLLELARKLGAPIYSDTQASQGRLPVAPHADLYAGSLPLWSPAILEILEKYDAALLVGIDFPRQYIYHEPSSPLSEGMRVVQIDTDERQIAKNHPVEVGLAADLRAGLSELTTALAAETKWEHARNAVERCKSYGVEARQRRQTLRREIAAVKSQTPMTAEGLAGAVAAALPDNAIFVEEAPTTNRNVVANLGMPHDPAGHFGHRGWALGWALGASLGVKLAWPERPALALLGDGAALYGIQGLWSAAHYKIPVVFVIANNSQYKILKDVGPVMGLAESTAGRHVGLDIRDPAVDYVGLAESLGVKAMKVDSAVVLEERAREALRGTEPVLLEATLAE
jgi:benzoylformate decarboxylase